MNSINRKKTVFIKSNHINIDPRLKKEVDSLRFNGYSVTLLSWDREKSSKNKIEKKYNLREIRLGYKAPYGIKIIFLLPIWWIFVIYWLCKLDFDTVHAINFDSIIPAFFVGKLRLKDIIYEVYDVYADEISLPKILRNFLVYIDKIFIRFVNAVIIVDESRIDEFNGIPNNNVVSIYNSPEDILNSKNKNFKNDISKDNFHIFFAGLLERHRSIETIIDVVKSLENVKLIIGGYGSLVNHIKLQAKESSNIVFLGKMSHDDVLRRTFSSDLLFSLYDPTIQSYKYASSNKLFEAMMCEKPILVSYGTSMDKIVEKFGCGLIVNCESFDEIKNSILRLKKNPDLCKKLGSNGRKAYESIFNWGKMEERLLDTYKNLER